jgi:S-disulfanyl-L-cysteine oxidoreductase SoxD
MATFTMRMLRLLSVVLLLGSFALAQSRPYGVGSTPSEGEIRAWDISISPSGKELPPGRGTAQEGTKLYVQKGCAGCHGAELKDGRAPKLIRDEPKPGVDPWQLGRVLPFRAPYATTVWDYINRGMPLNQEGTLTPDEVYSLVAFLLFRNGVIQENAVMDAETLPKVQMPIREGWAPLPDWKPAMQRLDGYPY